MTQQECLALPHHWTHLGICYPGSNAGVNLHCVTGCSVPEPATLGLLMLALFFGYITQRWRCHA